MFLDRKDAGEKLAIVFMETKLYDLLKHIRKKTTNKCRRINILRHLLVVF